ncbi:type III effector protein [Streptomyces sp. TRM70308]|uniref:type III effector protein n=1 Tax=Streptomyces TaxID=1883 RepID=UPI0022496BB9|nr:type III effector protein [Streptomyces sp. JHD 1]MCX2968074.1 type III effector protein [Streptomyces sp. JHD 1]
MPTDDPSPAAREARVPAPAFFAALAALRTIQQAVHAGHPDRIPREGAPDAASGPPTADQALAALLALREVREQLACWEPPLIEAARQAGASWAELAPPLGVASRQAAERRYLRVRPGAPGSTGEQRVQATRDRRAADRTVTTWARGNAAALRQLAGQITALTDLPARARTPLDAALADDDAAALITPLADTRSHLESHHPDLAARLATIARHTERLRQDSRDQRAGPA